MLPKSSLELKWKDHSVDLSAFDSWVKSVEPSCCGNSADSKLTLWFMEELSEESRAAIEAKWSELDDAEHELCKSYKSAAELAKKAEAKAAAVKSMKVALISKSWEQMSAAERKVMLGLESELSDSELGL